MALIVKDRVRETSTTTGTGTITLGGAFTGFRSFADIGNGNTTYYCISGGSQFEVGIGTYTASGTTLSRDTVLSNSLGTTALINFSAGTKDVFVTYPSDKAILGTTSAVASTGTGSVVLNSNPSFATDITVNGLTVGRGDGNIATNTALGVDAIGSPLATAINVNNVGVGYNTLNQITSGVGSFTILNGGNYPTFDNDVYEAQLVYVSGTPMVAGGVAPTIVFSIYSGAVTSIDSIVNHGKGWTATDTVFTIDPVTFPSSGAVFTCQIASLLTSANNTALGYNAGNTATINSNSVYLGSGATGTGTNEIVIGANATGLGDNTAVIGNTSTTSTTLRGSINAAGSISLTATAGTVSIGGSVTSGAINIGGSAASATGLITLGRSTGTQTVGIATGANGNGVTKTVNIGTGTNNASSTTNVNVGGTVGGGTLTFGQSTSTQTVNIANGANASPATKTVNIGTNASTGTTNIAIGSTGGTSTTTLNGAVTVVKDATINGINITRGAGALTGNMGVGQSALASVSLTGLANTGIGRESLLGNTTGANNVGLGFFTLRGNTTGSNNVAVGPQSLLANVTGSNNVAVGESALNANTNSLNIAVGTQALTANTTGNNNVVLGYQGGYLLANNVTQVNNLTQSIFIGNNVRANTINDTNSIAIGHNAQGLGNNTTVIGNSSTTATKLFGTLETVGDATINGVKVGKGTGSGNASNTAVGFESLISNTTGSGNTGIGYRALRDNNTGIYNTAIGEAALGKNTTGAANSAFGLFALRDNTTGGNNTAIGFSSLLVNTTGTANLALGKDVLANNTTASGNTGVGVQSLNQNTTGSNNVAIGVSALFGNTTGASNVAIGSETLNNNTTGVANIAIGEQAGRYTSTGTANTASNYSTYIGYRARSSSATATNEVVISGDQSIGLGSNTTVIGNSSTTQTKLFGAIQSTTYTVATLPSASTVGVGARAFVTDATTPVFGAAVAGGGAVPVPVYSTGSAWNVG
jgi:hypothetical protein